MGDALLDLEYVLRSRKEQLTLQEANILLTWRAQAMRDFTVGLAGGSILSWLATRRLSNIFRVNLTLGAAAACGLWRFGSSVDKSVDRILSLEGSRIQRELASVMLRRYHDNPRVLQRLSKHFYYDEVYDDSSVDKPTFRWRMRNIFGEPAENVRSTSNNEETDARKNDSKKNDTEQKQVNANMADNSVENPFDFVFEGPEDEVDVPQPDSSRTTQSLRKHSRKEKRARRRQRRHHQDELEV